MTATRPRLLDLFSGAGGAAVGYHRAGFEVVGVDIRPQPNYPFEHHVADALTYPLDGFDVVHASPPCQDHSALSSLHPRRGTGWMLDAILERLGAGGTPYVVENVVGADGPVAVGVYRVLLCGSAFGLSIRRHRWFWSNVALLVPGCDHAAQRGHLVGVYGASDGAHPEGFKHPGTKRGPRQATTAEAREVMGMLWARRRREITEAIPPAYTEFIGRQLMAAVLERRP